MEAAKSAKPSRDAKRQPKPGGKTLVKPRPDGTDPTSGGTLCGAGLRGKPGQTCRKPAGHGTDHPGEGRCKLHGGTTPIKHGRYSTLTTRPRIRELLARLDADPDPMDLLPELGLMRALVIDFVERYDEMYEGLMSWQQSFDKGFQADWGKWVREMRKHVLAYEGDPDDKDAPKMPDPTTYLPGRPLQVVDLATASSLATQIGQMVDRINKMREDKTFSMATLGRLVEAMSGDLTQAALEVIDDEQLRDTLLDAVDSRWKLIQLSELAGKRPGPRAEEA